MNEKNEQQEKVEVQEDMFGGPPIVTGAATASTRAPAGKKEPTERLVFATGSYVDVAVEVWSASRIEGLRLSPEGCLWKKYFLQFRPIVLRRPDGESMVLNSEVLGCNPAVHPECGIEVLTIVIPDGMTVETACDLIGIGAFYRTDLPEILLTLRRNWVQDEDRFDRFARYHALDPDFDHAFPAPRTRRYQRRRARDLKRSTS